MTASTHIVDLIQDYLDGTLTPEERQRVDTHLLTCKACRDEMQATAALMASVDALPRSIAPAKDLWPAIEERLTGTLKNEAAASLEQRTNGRTDRLPAPKPTRRLRFRSAYGVALAAVLVGLAGALWLWPRLFPPAWHIVRLEGAPRIGAQPLETTGRLRPGDWLETDDRSRAALDVGSIGQVEIEPRTRLQMIQARPDDHRLALSEGTIHARIWAPPRLFFVETPSALAIDLGCAYTLHVDSTGSSILHVTSGYVELQHGDNQSVVPAGWMCLTRPGHGPGTPFDENASEAFRNALARFDFEDDGDEALTALLDAATPDDTPTLWRLMYKVDLPARGRLYDGLVALVPPPEGVTRDEVLSADLDAIEAWDEYLGLDLDSGWFLRLLKNKKKRPS